MKELELKNVQITGGFWKKYQELVLNVVIPYQWKILNDQIEGIEKSHAVENFKIAAGVSKGKFEGFVFQDSDLYKWIEAVGNALQIQKNCDLEAKADEIIGYIAAAQEPDGYLNTWYQLVEPDKKWNNVLECHELYCAGHFIEAAVAYYKGTGKETILNVACKLADHIGTLFGEEPAKKHGYPGHQELELALIKLYDLTKKESYLKLAEYFLTVRGTNDFYEEEFVKRGKVCHWTQAVETEPNRRYNQFSYKEYNQFHLPVKEQETAVGHAVRGVYMYTAMADLAYHKGDSEMLDACRLLWNDIVGKQMYINGSIGSTPSGEAFSRAYDLPNDTNYSETCASLGLIFFSFKMLQNEEQGKYADVIERAFYNTVLAGLGRDGKHFFYVNPLEMIPENNHNNPERNHIKTVRQQWYACACCPPNIARTLAGFGRYIYGTNEEKRRIYVNMFADSKASFFLGEDPFEVEMKTSMPWEGIVQVKVSGKGSCTLAIRIPQWANWWEIRKGKEILDSHRGENGYLLIEVPDSSNGEISVQFEMKTRCVQADRRLHYNAGKAALMRGPLLYCLEGIDNGAWLNELRIDPQEKVSEEKGIIAKEEAVILRTQGVRKKGRQTESLYFDYEVNEEQTELTAIPYYLWNNRGEHEMITWIPVV